MPHTNAKPVCNLVPESSRYSEKVIRSVEFDGMDLVIEFQGEGFSYGRLTFPTVEGFRVLDERNLVEFWDEYHEGNGWLWEVESGGWLDLERQRRGFLDHEFLPQMREYLVVDDRCVSVFTMHLPVIEDFGTEPLRQSAA